MSHLIKHVENTFKLTDKYESKITKDILSMEGMTGKKTRHFYNNICNINDARYLEIGTWKGSSICSAMCGNEMICLAIDNFKSFGGPKEEFLINFNKFKGKNDATFIEKDCWKVDINTLGKFNIYMYDGDHSSLNHYKALNYYLPCLDNEFIYIVDDWNSSSIRDSTLKSIKDNSLNILYKKEIFSEGNPGIQRCKNDWHNGIVVFVLKN